MSTVYVNFGYHDIESKRGNRKRLLTIFKWQSHLALLHCNTVNGLFRQTTRPHLVWITVGLFSSSNWTEKEFVCRMGLRSFMAAPPTLLFFNFCTMHLFLFYSWPYTLNANILLKPLNFTPHNFAFNWTDFTERNYTHILKMFDPNRLKATVRLSTISKIRRLL